jgi:Tfp pilus assembly protein PilV
MADTINHPYQKGQTLVETIVATVVVVLLVTGLIAGITASLRATQSARRRSLATKLTQEGLEIVRSLRDSGWNDFYALHPTGDYCLDNSGTITTGSCTNNITITEGTLTYRFTRSIRFTRVNTDYMEVFLQVTWVEGSLTRTSNSKTVLTNWR